jgi:co-chaperonin GroES (HSP10)
MEVAIDRIVYQPVNPGDMEADDKSTSGFGIQSKEAGTEEAIRFVVVAVGPGEYNPYHDKHVPTSVCVGDVIVFPTTANKIHRERWKNAPTIDGVKYFVRRECEFQFADFVIVERAKSL